MKPAVTLINSFSKILFPGMRLGWITSNPMFGYRLEVLTDSSTQHPHGIGQVFVAEMLDERGWGIKGYLKWINSLCIDYQRRRDLFLDVFRKKMGSCPYASAASPSAGMFIWIEVHYEHHPRYCNFAQENGKGSGLNIESLNDQLFQRIFDKGVVIMPAKTFAVLENTDVPGQKPPLCEVRFSKLDTPSAPRSTTQKT